ncbi:MAG: GNAT family N-acetyltransferase [Saccharofermentanales bacterium]
MDVKIDVTDIVIETDRLILRYWKESDLADFYAYASVDGVGEMAGWRHHGSIDESLNILHCFMEEKDVFAIVHKVDDKVVGSLGLHYSWANEETKYVNLKTKEIGYVLSNEYWGQGLISEAVTAVIDYCFGQLDVDALTCGHFFSNNQSRRVIEKCGFVFVKHSQFYAKQLQRSINDLKYILLRKPVDSRTDGGQGSSVPCREELPV